MENALISRSCQFVTSFPLLGPGGEGGLPAAAGDGGKE